MTSRLPPAYGFRLAIYISGRPIMCLKVLRVLLGAVTVKSETVTGVCTR